MTMPPQEKQIKKVYKTAVQSVLFINCYKTLMGSSHILKTIDWLGWKEEKEETEESKELSS